MSAGSRAIILAGLLALAAPQARADGASAHACAAKLPRDARTIFDTVLPKLTSGADLRGVVTASTRGLAMSGAIQRGEARASAIAAGRCLQLAGG